MAEKKKIKRTRLFKTEDYKQALQNLARKLVKVKPDIELKPLSSEEQLQLPAAQRLTYAFLYKAIADAKFQEKEIF